MSDIFISYAQEDKLRAEKIATALQKHGWSVWWDRKIPVGKSFEEVIEAQLTAAKCVMVLWSQHSINSNWVKEEANEGLSRSILAPVLIDEVRIPLGFRMIQAAKIISWDGNLLDEVFFMLIEDVKNIIDKDEKDNKNIFSEIEKELSHKSIKKIKHHVYISYSQNTVSDFLVAELYYTMRYNAYTVFRDEKDMHNGEDNMKRIRESEFIILVLSEKYFLSEYRMFELHEIWRDSGMNRVEFEKRVLPIRIEELQLNNPGTLNRYIDHLVDKKKNWASLVEKCFRYLGQVQLKEYIKIRDIKNDIGELTNCLHCLNDMRPQLLSEANFQMIKERIERRLQ